MAERLFQVIGRADMNNDPKFRTNEARVENRLEVDKIVGDWIGSRTLDECMEVFDRESVTVAPVYDIEQIMNDPHFREREIIVDLPDTEMGTVAMHNITPRLSSTPGGFTRPAPALGQHNAEVLARIGIKESDLTKLKNQGVV
jgi:crotonobetainyl-CoA:carnitine CoA-transferase CaiB-like acyl-CoA transferase